MKINHENFKYLFSQHYIKENGKIVIGRLPANLREARSITGRHVITGKKLRSRQHISWSGMISYFVFLEQMAGFVLGGEATGVRFDNFLQKFSKKINTIEERKAIYALRNSLVHNFGLYNKNLKDLKKQHYFILYSGNPLGKIIELPEHCWSGNLEAIWPSACTKINIELLADHIEDIWCYLGKEIKKGKIQLKGGTAIIDLTSKPF